MYFEVEDENFEKIILISDSQNILGDENNDLDKNFIKAYFRKVNHLGIGHLNKSVLLGKNNFTDLNQKCQKELVIRGDSISNCFFVKQRSCYLK